jgi:hypothetical protein
VYNALYWNVAAWVRIEAPKVSLSTKESRKLNVAMGRREADAEIEAQAPPPPDERS